MTGTSYPHTQRKSLELAAAATEAKALQEQLAAGAADRGRLEEQLKTTTHRLAGKDEQVELLKAQVDKEGSIPRS